MTSSTIRVLVLEDFPIVLEGIVSWLGQQPDVAVVGQAADHAAARKELAAKAPDILLMDLMVGGRDGLDFIREIRGAYPRVAVLVFSVHDEMVYAERVLKAGAHGYVMKREPKADLLAALRAVALGELAVSRQVTLLLLKRVVQPTNAPAAAGVGDLTDRELHVFQMIGIGLSPRRIAEELKLSIKTVETHRENIKNKLSLHSSAEVIRAAALWLGDQAR
jgi:DNA-binding NarL/FixJ family response regulator